MVGRKWTLFLSFACDILCIHTEGMNTSGDFRARAYTSPQNGHKLSVTFPSLTRCDRSENDLDSFTGGMPSVENSWIDKRVLEHR